MSSSNFKLPPSSLASITFEFGHPSAEWPSLFDNEKIHIQKSKFVHTQIEFSFSSSVGTKLIRLFERGTGIILRCEDLQQARQVLDEINNSISTPFTFDNLQETMVTYQYNYPAGMDRKSFLTQLYSVPRDPLLEFKNPLDLDIDYDHKFEFRSLNDRYPIHTTWTCRSNDIIQISMNTTLATKAFQRLMVRIGIIRLKCPNCKVDELVVKNVTPEAIELMCEKCSASKPTLFIHED